MNKQKLLLGCIADDFTGGTDLCGILVKAGMRTVQMIGVPKEPLPYDISAVVIALKSRTTPVDEAVEESLKALRYLRSAGCQQFYFKYCSTFDSTPNGNIGAVIEAFQKELNCNFTIACPALPDNKRTIYQGHLFVGNQLLSDSGMKNHPLTPMTDSNLVRFLQLQVKGKVGLVDYDSVKKGRQAIAKNFSELSARGINIAIVDALSNDDLLEIGKACSDLPLITAGSGVALGLPQNFIAKGLLPAKINASSINALAPINGYKAIISGSCSLATQAQVAHFNKTHESLYIDPLLIEDSENGINKTIANAVNWALPKLSQKPILIYCSANSNEVLKAQEKFGVEKSSQLIEKILSEISKSLVIAGVDGLIVAGGETSGAMVKSLGISGLLIGKEIDPGVPWTNAIFSKSSSNHKSLALALKSGNFGKEDFFVKAWDKY